MLCDPMLVDVLRSAFPGLEVLSLTDHSVSKLAEDDQPLTDVLARLDKLPGDLMHLTLPKSLGLSALTRHADERRRPKPPARACLAPARFRGVEPALSLQQFS